MNEERQPVSALAERAFSMPRRPAPLAALGAELRLPGVWIEVCRVAAEIEPDWLAERLAPSDPLIAAIGACGNPVPDRAAARAICSLALTLCGRLDEKSGLAAAAALFGEAAPPDLGSLDAERHRHLIHLVASMRSERPARTRRISTVVTERHGRAGLGAVTVRLYPDRAGGLRLDAAMRLFAPRDEELDAAVEVARGQLGSSTPALLARVESEGGEPAGGDACGAALAVAAEAARRRRSIDAGTMVVGSLDPSGHIGRSRRPEWGRVERLLQRSGQGLTVFAPAAGTRQVKTLQGLRRALRAPSRRRRAAASAAAAVLLLAAAAALIAPRIGGNPDADKAARRALELVSSSPVHAAVSAARALSLSDDRLSREAAERVLASAPLTEATGQEEGHLIAVAVDSAGRVTTVSTKGRATRWALEQGQLRPLAAVAVPRGSKFLAFSRSGRWLLVRPPESYEHALLVDTAGVRATRFVMAPESAVFAVGGGDEAILAVADGEGLRLSDGGAAPDIEDVEALAFSPSGRLLAVAANSGRTAIYRRGGKGWTISRGWRGGLGAGEAKRIEVDDQGHTLLSVDGFGSAQAWTSRTHAGEFESTDGFGSLAGRRLAFVPTEHELRLVENSAGGTARVASFPAPVDAAAELQVAASPTGERAVVAGPDGLFSLLDLRRVRIPRAEVVTDSVVVTGQRLSALEAVGSGTRLVSWDLRDLSPPRVGPLVPGRGRIATATADGSLIFSSSDRDTIAIRRAANGKVVGSVGQKGDEEWLNLATDAEGHLLAAIDARRRAVTVWRLSRTPQGRISGRTIYRSPAVDDSTARFPDPVSISPDGRELIYGTAHELIVRDLRTGSEEQPSIGGIGEVIRARLTTAERLMLAGSRGVFELSGTDWSRRRHLSNAYAQDARSLSSGLVAATTPDGIHLVGGRQDINYSVSADVAGAPPATISVGSEGTALVPNFEQLPLVVLPDVAPDPDRLCHLAGGRSPDEGGRCQAPLILPPPLPAAGVGADDSGDVVLSAEGLGWVRLGQPLPHSVARLPAYTWGACQMRDLPGRAAYVISFEGTAESLALFSTGYAEEGAVYREETETATDRGLTPSSAGYSARTVYGRPDEKSWEALRWWLPRRDGERSLLQVSTGYQDAVPVAMSIADPHCETW